MRVPAVAAATAGRRKFEAVATSYPIRRSSLTLPAAANTQVTHGCPPTETHLPAGLPSLPGVRLGTATAAASAISIVAGALGATATPHPSARSTGRVRGGGDRGARHRRPARPRRPVVDADRTGHRGPGGGDPRQPQRRCPERAVQRHLHAGQPAVPPLPDPRPGGGHLRGSQAAFDRAQGLGTRDGLRLAFASSTARVPAPVRDCGAGRADIPGRLRDYWRGGQHFYANSNGPTVPANADVAGVIGLNNLLARTRSRASLPRPGAAPSPAQDTCVGPSCTGLTTPQDLWSIYHMPTDMTATSPVQNFGQGQQMGVIGEGATRGTISDLRAFETERRPAQIPVTIQSINDDGQDTSGTGEWDIDTQASTGMAPKASGETLYFAKDLTDPSVLGDFEAFQGDTNGPMQANASFGECEQDPTTPATGRRRGHWPRRPCRHGRAGMFTQARRTLCRRPPSRARRCSPRPATPGRRAPSCPRRSSAPATACQPALPRDQLPGVEPVCRSRSAARSCTARRTPPPRRRHRTPPGTASTPGHFTGGGNTFYIPEPAYQQGITMLDTQPCISQPDGTPYPSVTPCRGVPDVAAQSGDVLSNGYAVTMDGTPTRRRRDQPLVALVDGHVDTDPGRRSRQQPAASTPTASPTPLCTRSARTRPRTSTTSSTSAAAAARRTRARHQQRLLHQLAARRVSTPTRGGTTRPASARPTSPAWARTSPATPRSSRPTTPTVPPPTDCGQLGLNPVQQRRAVLHQRAVGQPAAHQQRPARQLRPAAVAAARRLRASAPDGTTCAR